MANNDHGCKSTAELECLQRQLCELKARNQELEQQLQQQAALEVEYCQHSLQSLQLVEEIIGHSADLDGLMQELLAAMLKIFASDRAWLLYPCDPGADSWRVLREHTRPEYPGALDLNIDLPMTREAQVVFERALNTPHPVRFDPASDSLPETAARFNIRSQMAMAIYPRSGKPWLFGMHQCSHERVWTDAEAQLFEQIGRRLPDGFDSLLLSSQLQESEQKYRSLVSNLPGVVFRCRYDDSRQISFVSEQVEDLTGYPAADLIHNHQISFSSIIHPADRSTVDAAISCAIERKEPYNLDYRLQSRCGQSIWVNECGQGIFDAEGVLQYLDGLLFDISARKKADEEIKRLEQALHQAERLRSLGTLAAGLAHEMNNPLAGILQNLQVLRSRLQTGLTSNQQVAEACGTDLQAIHSYVRQRQIDVLLDYAEQSSQQAARLVHTLLDFNLGQLAEKRPAVLSELLDETLQLTEEKFILRDGDLSKSIVIERDYARDLPPFNCDPQQLQQVFVNLLDNAATACQNKLNQLPQNDRPHYQPCIRLKLEENTEILRVEVCDNGVGIDTDEQQQPFDLFYTTKAPGEGYGLGLPLCYLLVTKNHQGNLRLASTLGQGSCFIVELPKQQE